MVSYEMRFKESVAKDLRHLPYKDVKRILERIEALRKEPRPAGCEKLSAQERYSVRQGVCRIIYEIGNEELVIIVVRVGHRREVYKCG